MHRTISLLVAALCGGLGAGMATAQRPVAESAPAHAITPSTSGLAHPPASADSSAIAARTFEIRPRAELTRQFDDGYRRHLDWHRDAGDPWAWYLWEVADGERAGLYVDGTFGHRWSDFDHAVDPRGDGADNDVNVEPFANRESNQAWRIHPELGGAAVDFERAPLVVRTEYHVRPGGEEAFVGAMRRLRPDAGDREYAVLQLVSGGEAPTFVVWAPAMTWADVAEQTDFWRRVAGGDPEREAARRALSEATDRERVELWRFRPDLSVCRAATRKCHSTVR